MHPNVIHYMEVLFKLWIGLRAPKHLPNTFKKKKNLVLNKKAILSANTYKGPNAFCTL